MRWRPGVMLAAVVLVTALVVLALQGRPAPVAPATQPPAAAPAPSPPVASVAALSECAGPPAMVAAARANAASLQGLTWSPFGQMEAGWEIYQPLIGHEIGTFCGGADPGFAAALAAWQGAHGLAATGQMDPASFEAMRLIWHARRPFVAEAAKACPPAADEAGLRLASPQESYGGKQVALRPEALAAYRAMIAAIRAEAPDALQAAQGLTLISGYRNPLVDGARCLFGSGCDGRARARCSAHRTGLAIDLMLGAAPGFTPESSDDANRRFQSKTAAYRWLVGNAARFGFAPYAFEPWHWEWTGRAA